MNPAGVATRPVFGARFLALVLLCFAAQFGLIAWLGQRRLPPQNPPGAVPTVQFASKADAEWLKITDPTLFALPHADSFSGPAWLSIPSEEVQPFTWTEPPRFLAFTRQPPLLPHNPNATLSELTPMPPPSSLDPLVPFVPESQHFSQGSTLQITGGLKNRRLAAQIQLPPWPFSDLLSNTVVQVMVDLQGRTFSPVILERCGLKAADDRAMDLVREMRFENLDPWGKRADSSQTMMMGELIFQWHTVPMNTNELQK